MTFCRPDIIISLMRVWNNRTVSRDTAQTIVIPAEYLGNTQSTPFRRQFAESWTRFDFFFPLAHTKTATMAHRTSPLPKIPGFYQSFMVSIMCFFNLADIRGNSQPDGSPTFHVPVVRRVMRTASTAQREGGSHFFQFAWIYVTGIRPRFGHYGFPLTLRCYDAVQSLHQMVGHK